MKKFLLGLLLATTAFAAEVKFSTLPLNTTPGNITEQDSFAYIRGAGPENKRLKLNDILNIPVFTAKFATYVPLASPTFTGVSGYVRRQKSIEQFAVGNAVFGGNSTIKFNFSGSGISGNPDEVWDFYFEYTLT